jgi:hypothetical protein
MALLSMYSLDLIMRVEIQFLNRLLKGLVSVGMFLVAFPGADLPYPWGRRHVCPEGKYSIAQALKWIKTSPYANGVLVHQLPAINVSYDLDPWGAETQLHPKSATGEWLSPKPVNEWPKESRTLSIWSVDTKDSGAHDWLPKGSVLLWDNFHARRDGNMDRAELLGLKKYKTVFAAGLTDSDTLNDVVVRVKVSD